MKISTLLAAVALSAGLVAGGSAVANAETIYVGTYGTEAACRADGSNAPAHPDWTWWECQQTPTGEWDLYYSSN